MTENQLRIGRREILGGCAVALSPGCTSSSSSDTRTKLTEGTVTTTTDEPVTPTGTTPTISTSRSADSTTTASTNGTTSGSADLPDFYIINLYGEEAQFSLRVGDGDNRLIEDEFLIPSLTGAIFEDIAETGSTYSVSADVRDEYTATGEWSLNSCTGTEAPDGNTDGGIEFVDDELRFRQNVCDAIFIGTERITYGNPDEYRV